MLNILILGGTKKSRLLAQKLNKKYDIIYSTLTKTKNILINKKYKQINGGFGGSIGLREYIIKNKINLCIDATHSFAENISKNAIISCKKKFHA